MKAIQRTFTLLAGALLATGLFAQAVVDLPNSAQSTVLTANVSEQAKVTVPSGITFNVLDITAITTAPVASVTVSNIALATATKQLKISVQAAAAVFTPSVDGAVTWAVGDVSWLGTGWTTSTGAAGTLIESAYHEVATCDADAAGCANAALSFKLAAKGTVKRSGSHTLGITWKFESIGS